MLLSFDKNLKDDKRKIASIMKKEYVSLKFSELHLILDNNYNEPRWMDTYILLYKASLLDHLCQRILS